jgi:hypothetical protein
VLGRNPREGGVASVVGGGGPGAGSSGESWALEMRSRRGVETEERAGRERLGGSAAEGGKRGVREWGATRRGGAVGPGPDGGRRRHQSERGTGGRRAPRMPAGQRGERGV